MAFSARGKTEQIDYDNKELVDKLLKQIVTDEYPLNPLELLGETSFNEPRHLPYDEIGTPIQEFFRGHAVLITGATGFMGKVIIEKLLRCIPHIKHVYMLIRAKRGKTHNERFQEIFKDRLFRRLEHEVPDYKDKVTVVCGDLTLPECGLSDQDRNQLINEVNVIYHGGATVNLDERIDLAIKTNVVGTQQIINLGKQMKNLKCLMYISTAYSNCPLPIVEEKLYPMPVNYNDVIEAVQHMKISSEEDLQKFTSKIILNWPNTYTFSKALAENVLSIEGKDLPYGIVRPSIMITTYKEPVRGWIDNYYGPVGLMVGTGCGVLHVYKGCADNKADLVPVDFVVNLAICASVSVYEFSKLSPVEKDRKPACVFNCTTGVHSPITWEDFLFKSAIHLSDFPSITALWYMSIFITNWSTLFAILHFFLHRIPGFAIDAYLKFNGQKPVLTKVYNTYDKVRNLIKYFEERSWIFKIDNTENLWEQLNDRDKELFYFDLKNYSWDEVFRWITIGLRVYLVGDDIHTLPAARRKWKRLYYMHCILKTITYSAIVYLIWIIVRNILF